MFEINVYSIVIIAYVLAIIAISLVRSRGVKGQDDFMVAGRSVSAWLLAGTLICTWIGAGSLLGGGGRAFRGGLSQLWMSAGAWLGIVIIFFLAARVRRIARVFGAIVVILGSTTIFSYQLRGGAFVLEYMMKLPQVWGIIFTAVVMIIFTSLAGLRSIIASAEATSGRESNTSLRLPLRTTSPSSAARKRSQLSPATRRPAAGPPNRERRSKRQ